MGTAFGELESLRTQAPRQSVQLFFEYTSFWKALRQKRKDMRMLGSIVELLLGVLLSALILLVGFCILGSMFAALRAVSRRSDCDCEQAKEIFAFGAEVTELDDRMIATGVIVMTNPENHCGL